MVTQILELITIGARVFSEERQRYYEGRTKKLLKIIANVADADFYDKDMDAKGKAERTLLIETEELRKEYIKEALQ